MQIKYRLVILYSKYASKEIILQKATMGVDGTYILLTRYENIMVKVCFFVLISVVTFCPISQDLLGSGVHVDSGCDEDRI